MKTFLLIVVALIGILLLAMEKYAIGILICIYVIGYIVYSVVMFFVDDNTQPTNPENMED